VWLVKTAPVHVGHWGTYVTTPEVTPASATVAVKVRLENHSAAAANVKVRTQVYELSADGQRVGKAVAAAEATNISIAEGASETSAVSLRVNNPKLWNLQKPNLYAAVTTVERNGKAVDTYETVFGIRTIKFDPDKGFFLNGELVEIQGVCNHHDLGA